MRVAFVGVKRKYQELAPEYRDHFNRYHLELPYYYAKYGKIDVLITTVDYEPNTSLVFPMKYCGGPCGELSCTTEERFKRDDSKYDVVVHWRKWNPELYRPEAINVINCQDHSFSTEWQQSAARAFSENKLYGILCFPKWHKDNLLRECPWLPEDRAIDGLTLGVDTQIYTPSENKDPRKLLWASDPGRGLHELIPLFLRLFTIDKKYELHVCYPDYCRPPELPNHPAIINHGNVANGPELWDLFNTCGVLPYTSTFMEPSSRTHRQAMAAGSLVLYPPNRGTPSDLIEDGRTGIVQDPRLWPAMIVSAVDTGKWKDIGRAARDYAVSENWEVQADRFVEYFESLLGERR